MGYYVNPCGMPKEIWLKENSEAELALSAVMNWDFSDQHYLPVCLVDNGPFTAAAICYCVEERDDFVRPEDHRSKRWYAVAREKLRPWYDE